MEAFLERWTTGWRGPALAALIALIAGLPGLIALPVLDRDEARFAQGSAQMIEDRDYTAIRFLDSLRGGAAPGAHWAQAASVNALSDVEARAIWAFRLPSLLGMMLAAAACAWGAAALFGARVGTLAGAILGVSFLGSTVAGIATADGLFIGAAALTLAAFAHLYLAALESQAPARRHLVLFWIGVILAVLVKGWLILALAFLTAAALYAMDRRAPWLRPLGWGWGLIALVAVAGPWIVAVTVATDGVYWVPVARQGARFGLATLASLILLFPVAGLLAPAVVAAVRERTAPGVRLAIAFVGPAWVLFELAPDRTVLDMAPLHVGLAWLLAHGFAASGMGRRTRTTGAVLSAVSALVLAGLTVWLASRFGDGATTVKGVVAAIAVLASGATAAGAVYASRRWRSLALALVLGALAHAVIVGSVAPKLRPLWPNQEVLWALEADGLDPREGLAIGPVALVGYAEPSLVFALGRGAEIADPAGGVLAVAQGRPALVEARRNGAFLAEARRRGVTPVRSATIEGYSWTRGDFVDLHIYRPEK